MEASFYEYTKSAQEIKKFKCEEKCREIAAEYERFNKENGVYEFFGEILLEVAKDNYSMNFSGSSILEYLKEKNVSNPSPQCLDMDVEESWYNDSQLIRDVCPRFYRKRMESDYLWYTLWRIVKAYNCKNGCLIVRTPFQMSYGDNYTFEIDWSSKSQEYVTGDKFREQAKKENKIKPFFVWGTIFGAAGACIVYAIIFIALCIFNGYEEAQQILTESKIYKWVLISILILTPIFFCTFIRKVGINLDTETNAIEIKTHCKRIEETRNSSFDLIRGKNKNY